MLWAIFSLVAGVIGLLHCGISVPNAVKGKLDGPSPVPLLGEAALVGALLSTTGIDAKWPIFVNAAIVAVWLGDYACRLLAVARFRSRR